MMRARSLFLSAVFGAALLAATLPLRSVVADMITTNIYLVRQGDVQQEDVYVAATTAKVDGTIDGDLVISTGSLEISGTVTGDVFVLSHGQVEVTGEVGGSLRGAARSVVIAGTVGDDLTVAAVTTQIPGVVGRDALVFAGSLELDGEVQRNVDGRMISAWFDGTVGHDVDIAVSTLTLEGGTVVDGDVLYRSGADASIAATVQVGGQLERLPTRGSWGVELVLTVATIVGFLGFLLAGIVLIWLFRRTAPRAVHTVLSHPLRASLVGVGALVVAPVLIVVLMLTLVGVPVAVAVLVLYVLALIFGPVPAVTAVGSKALRGRWGLFAAFLIGAVMWRLGIWLVPLLGVGLYLAALGIGVGAWVIALWEERREAPVAEDLLPKSKPRPTPERIPTPIGWDAPLAPGTKTADEEAPPADEAAPEGEPGVDAGED
jgi:hypothetical protein